MRQPAPATATRNPGATAATTTAPTAPPPPPVSDALTVDMAANGTAIALHSGQTLIIRLPENPSTGYAWRPTAGIGPHLALVSKNYASDKPVPGAPGVETFTLTAGRPGFDSLRLALFPPGRHRPPTKQFHLKIAIHHG